MTTHPHLDLTSDGYRPVAPDTEAADIDAQCVKRMHCRKCGGACYYQPYSRPGSYRAFAICLDCGHEEEF